jgi:hypothetical protein
MFAESSAQRPKTFFPALDRMTSWKLLEETFLEPPYCQKLEPLHVLLTFRVSLRYYILHSTPVSG